MLDLFEKFLVLAYAGNSIIAMIGYAPQIWKLVKDTTRSENFSLPTWALWVWTTLMTFSYATIVNGDPVFMIVSGAYFLGTSAIFALILYNRFLRQRSE